MPFRWGPILLPLPISTDPSGRKSWLHVETTETLWNFLVLPNSVLLINHLCYSTLLSAHSLPPIVLDVAHLWIAPMSEVHPGNLRMSHSKSFSANLAGTFHPFLFCVHQMLRLPDLGVPRHTCLLSPLLASEQGISRSKGRVPQ